MIKSIPITMTILFLLSAFTNTYTDAYSNVLNKIIPIKCRDNKVLNTSVIIHDHIISAKYDDDNDNSINDKNGNNLFYKGEVIVNYKTYPQCVFYCKLIVIDSENIKEYVKEYLETYFSIWKMFEGECNNKGCFIENSNNFCEQVIIKDEL